ncbi:O-antigen ligase family protein [Candidatus Scalindua japonica]|uniref:O-antigen ligase family protein n=1 Tax=Candidatus Scalindua japonica TaxID=1284222 RepID=UPI000BDF2353|nr:O-antigen ligase family protein [Candidatus Scalindua japonica]
MLTRFPLIADRVIEWGIIFLLVFTPLALPTRYGLLHLWVYTIIEITIFVLVIIWLLKRIIIAINANSDLRIPNSIIINRFGFVKTPLNIPIILFVGLIILQLIPLPPGALKLLSANTYYLYQNSNPLPATRNQNLEISPTKLPISNEQPDIQTQRSEISDWLPITIYHYATKSEFIMILAYIGMFFLVTNTPGLRIDRFLLIIMGVGFFVSFLGILQKFAGADKIYWLLDSPGPSFFGSFINRNHFAGYIIMVIPLSLGLLISRFGSITFHKTMTWRVIFTEFESHILGNGLLVFAIMIMVSALFLSLSRGGILSFAVTIVVFVTIISLSRKTRSIISKGRKVTIITLFLAFILLVWLGIGPVMERLSDISSPDRNQVFQDTIDMTKDFPLLGSGLGTFQHLFPKYKTLERQQFYDHAHNDYVELLSDSGLIGFILIIGSIIIFIRKILVRWWERGDSFAKGVTLGGFCGIIAILCHSVTDFNLHIPANALFLSFLLGLTWNAVNRESSYNEN